MNLKLRPFAKDPPMLAWLPILRIQSSVVTHLRDRYIQILPQRSVFVIHCHPRYSNIVPECTWLPYRQDPNYVAHMKSFSCHFHPGRPFRQIILHLIRCIRLFPLWLGELPPKSRPWRKLLINSLAICAIHIWQKCRYRPPWTRRAPFFHCLFWIDISDITLYTSSDIGSYHKDVVVAPILSLFSKRGPSATQVILNCSLHASAEGTSE